MKFIRVDMTRKAIQSFNVPREYEGLGGRGLTSIMINNEVPATCDPLGPENKLIFAPGYLSGTPLINTSRLSIGAKSPLTGGIKESNVGGTVSVALARKQIAAVIIEGRAGEQEYYILKIDLNGEAELVDAMQYKGLRTYTLVERLKSAYGNKNSVTCVGPAGDFQLTAASIQTTDNDGRPCRAAGRGGLGAVMGSKGLKALLVAGGGKASGLLADQNAFRQAAKDYAKAVRDSKSSGQVLPEFGTACMVAPINAAGALPTRNAREGSFEHAAKISGETMAGIIRDRGGKTTHKGCAQCIIDCSNEYVDRNGNFVTSSLEYETIWSMGAMLGNADLDAIARLDFLCDDIGLDTISTGVAIAVAMDTGYREFGDAPAAIQLLEEVAQGTEMGKIIGNGPAAVGKYFNHDRVPVVKSQSIAAYDPRVIHGMAVTYATTPMGADHTAGWVVDQNLEEFGGTLDRFSAKGQVEASRKAQIEVAAVDTIGLCDFARSGLASPQGYDNLYQMIAAKCGRSFGAKEWFELGVRVLKAERGFNRKAGFTNRDDRLPEMFYREPLPPHNKVVVISDDELDSTFEF
ncbi:MAG: aldehyde ferredoxin oxidoreductase C-terminal domain-containing protein [Desulfobacterales bacterium]|jgi:aldehyde:ferredoxin oxidoreductase